MYYCLKNFVKNGFFKIKESVMFVITRLVVATAYLLRNSNVVDKLN